MEINPRFCRPSIPLCEAVSGINPFVFMEGLKKGVIYEPTGPCQSGVCRYNRPFAGYHNKEVNNIRHDEHTYSTTSPYYSHTYRVSPECKPYTDIIRDLDRDVPQADFLAMKAGA